MCQFASCPTKILQLSATLHAFFILFVSAMGASLALIWSSSEFLLASSIQAIFLQGQGPQSIHLT